MPRHDEDWAQQVPRQRYRGEYDDYGWESGESVLPEFRDPEVHEMPYERNMFQRRRPPIGEEQWRGGQRERYAPDMRGYGGGYERENQAAERAPWRVQGPHTGKGPRGYQRSDERIREDVSDRLAQHGWIDASDIEVQVSGGVVTLQGSVDSRSTKRMAEDAVDSVPGVRDINNQLRIGSQGG